jgi:hypothetical protein
VGDDHGPDRREDQRDYRAFDPVIEDVYVRVGIEGHEEDAQRRQCQGDPPKDPGNPSSDTGVLLLRRCLPSGSNPPHHLAVLPLVGGEEGAVFAFSSSLFLTLREWQQ